MSSRLTPDDATLRAWDIAHVWHPFTPQRDWADTIPLIIDRAEGFDLIDTDGNRYLDGVGSLWCNVHGHRHPKLDAAIRDQLDRVAHSTMLGLTHRPGIELARRLVEIAPAGLTRVFFSDSGATAVEVGLKLAFQYFQQKAEPEPKRTKFLAFTHAYHGDTIGDVSLGGVTSFHGIFGPLLFPVLRAPTPHCYRCPLGLTRPSCQIACLDEVEKLLDAHPGEVAALVIEPLVQGAGEMIVQPEGYLKGLRALTRKHGTLLIADEVAVGFGRTGKMFACEHEEVSPDILCLAKGLTGGYLPLAATMTTDTVHEAFNARAADGKNFAHGHTFFGNPLGAAVALANLDVFEDENLLAQLPAKVAHLTRRLEEFRALAHVGDVRQKGMIAGIELVADPSTKTPFPSEMLIGRQICTLARSHGVLIRPLGDVLVVMPAPAMPIDKLDTLVDVMIHCTRAVTESVSTDG